jgi:hypothetical protein
MGVVKQSRVDLSVPSNLTLELGRWPQLSESLKVTRSLVSKQKLFHTLREFTLVSKIATSARHLQVIPHHRSTASNGNSITHSTHNMGKRKIDSSDEENEFSEKSSPLVKRVRKEPEEVSCAVSPACTADELILTISNRRNP